MNQQKVALITGAGSGIGAAIARTLSARGFHVLVTDRDVEAAERVAREIGGEARVLDVTDAAAVTAAAQAAITQHERLDVWVSNAGVSSMTPFLEVDAEQLTRTLAVNLQAVFTCGQAAARAMVGTGRPGRIVNLASMAGKQGRVPYLSDYVASKFGVVGLTQAMAFELAASDITVMSGDLVVVGDSIRRPCRTGRSLGRQRSAGRPPQRCATSGSPTPRSAVSRPPTMSPGPWPSSSPTTHRSSRARRSRSTAVPTWTEQTRR